MFTKLLNYLIIVAMACLSCIKINAQILPMNQSAESFDEAMPKRVTYLFKWPDESTLSDSNRVSAKDSRLIALVESSSIDWIKKVLNPAFLPQKENYIKENMIMIQNETSQLDVCRLRWEKNGYDVQLSQTASIMTIKLTPLESTSTGETSQEKVNLIKKIIHQVINNTGMRYGPVDVNGLPTKIEVKNLQSKIVEYSFKQELIKRFPNSKVIAARPIPRPNGEGISSSTRNGREIDIENQAKNINWDNSLSSWGYWWRHICWWNDGKTIGIYFLKYESESWVPEYNSMIDERWFEGVQFKGKEIVEKDN